ncbi:hypothetical protein C3V45_09510 [Campylobacter coli]|uniref:Uncharacterized protein n=1 Tax=Campylobacter coli TaxID=195 RepID=A0A691X1X4_CAMCO|nr:hypothetical protein [Campylobacter coli]EAI4209495.1 hypothetical protein [Campylobacter coli]EAI5942614.1 hypothetical protein [Campylobacter coli]EAJ2540115.1 hypothetical protein [Campylobacter coli]EAJ3177984.1 hypothetical protein [Campylobacter coli]EAJ3599200.1 hypothetical protein [Campylobacter coli]
MKHNTQIHSLRVEIIIKEFLSSLENANQFVIQLIKDNQEFKNFVMKKQARENKNQPSLFKDF